MPEKVGNSAIPWATPTVNGFIIAAVKPTEAPTETIANPTIRSKPNASAIGIRIPI